MNCRDFAWFHDESQALVFEGWWYDPSLNTASDRLALWAINQMTDSMPKKKFDKLKKIYKIIVTYL